MGDRDFDTIKKKVKDLRPETGKKTFICFLCNQIFPYKCTLKRHIEVKHLGEKPFECHECKKCFHSKYKFEEHHRIHTGDKPYACSKCDMAFVQKVSLKRHCMALHEKEKKFICHLCGRTFNLQEQLTQHRIRMHELAAPEKRPFACSVCGHRFIKQYLLTRHTRLSHRRNDKCFLCNQEFNFDPYQKAPFVWSKQKKIYECPECEKMVFECFKCHEMFPLRTRIIKMQENRRQKLVLVCSLCDEQFYNIDELKQHCLNHMRRKQYNCMQCLLLYSCTECGLQLNNKSKYQEHCCSHSKSHHDCSVCEEKFLSHDNLKQHSRTHVKTETFYDEPIEEGQSDLQVWLPHLENGLEMGKAFGSDDQITTSVDDDPLADSVCIL